MDAQLNFDLKPMRVRKTSLEAYNKMRESGVLSRRRWECYEALFHHGPLTSNEIFQFCDLRSLGNYRHNANARMSELREMGVAEEIGEKICSVTGARVILWDVTEHVARPFKRPVSESRKQKIARLEGIISNMRTTACNSCLRAWEFVE